MTSLILLEAQMSGSRSIAFRTSAITNFLSPSFSFSVQPESRAQGMSALTGSTPVKHGVKPDMFGTPTSEARPEHSSWLTLAKPDRAVGGHKGARVAQPKTWQIADDTAHIPWDSERPVM